MAIFYTRKRKRRMWKLMIVTWKVSRCHPIERIFFFEI
jgi:hypothetical protein